MSEVEKLKASVLKNLNVPALMSDMIDQMLKPALEKVVADSSNKLDDVLMDAIYPTFEKEVKAQAEKYWEMLLAPEVVQAIEDGGAESSPA